MKNNASPTKVRLENRLLALDTNRRAGKYGIENRSHGEENLRKYIGAQEKQPEKISPPLMVLRKKQCLSGSPGVMIVTTYRTSMGFYLVCKECSATGEPAGQIRYWLSGAGENGDLGRVELRAQAATQSCFVS